LTPITDHLPARKLGSLQDEHRGSSKTCQRRYLRSSLWSARVDGKNTHRTLFRLREPPALRETGELDRIVAAPQAHAERRYADLDLDDVAWRSAKHR
jgi:hypothetical protein